MNRQRTLSKDSYRAFRTFSFGTMCFLTLFCIVLAVKNDIFRDSYICFVNIAILVSLIFLTLLTGFLLSKTDELAGSFCYFVLFLFNVYVATFFLSVSASFYQTPGHAGLLTILYSLCYFFTMTIFLTLWLYQKQFLEASVISRVITVCISTALAIYTAFIIINQFRPFLFRFTDQGLFSDQVKDYASIITALFCLILLCIATFSSRQNRSRRVSFICCIFAPALFVELSINQDLVGWSIYLWGIISFTVLLPLYLYFFNAHDELEKDVVRKEKEQTQLQITAMMSQMQPHFLYNSLAVIAALCEENPKLAAEATNTFSVYLRENMDFANKSNPISFSEELKHIKTYVWLEKLRFPNKLNIEYDINCTAFLVPALSVQPMVENAVKHGICKSRSGGTVKIYTFETDLFYSVIVSDDGIGFDEQDPIDDGRQHSGIKNTRYRIQEMVGGSLDIVSVPGKGTTVTIKIPKYKQFLE